jgi:exodeoxyribonuclease-3
MKIASFNVNSLRARLELVMQWLAKHEPDVLCVQETKVQDKDFPAEPFKRVGYHCAFKGQKSYNGVAIFSRTPLRNVSYGLDSEPKDEARLIAARAKGITIVNTYVPQGYEPDSDRFQYKLEWFARLGQYFEKRFKPADKVLWIGDLNVAPEPIDVFDPEGLIGSVCFHPKVSEAFETIKQWGFVDLFRKFCPEPKQYSFWDYRLPNAFKRNLGWRLDHVLATKALAKRCSACHIDKAPRQAPKPSDHTPVVAEFDL